MRPIILRPDAELDIDAASQHYAAERLELAESFQLALNETIERIAARPLLYKKIHKEMRSAPLSGFPYRVYYTATSDQIAVHGVIHASRHPRIARRRLH